MIYKNENIPSAYNKIAEISDNFVVWVRESTLQSGQTYSAYIQYFSPSFSYFFVDNYKIKEGSSYSYNAHYTNNGMYSYIDYYDSEYSLTTLSVDSDDITSDEFNRADFPNIFICQFILAFIFVWVIHNLTKVCVKGGVW